MYKRQLIYLAIGLVFKLYLVFTGGSESGTDGEVTAAMRHVLLDPIFAVAQEPIKYASFIVPVFFGYWLQLLVSNAFIWYGRW